MIEPPPALCSRCSLLHARRDTCVCPPELIKKDLHTDLLFVWLHRRSMTRAEVAMWLNDIGNRRRLLLNRPAIR